MIRRIAIALTCIVSVAGLSACGTKTDRTTKAETEGEYVDLGPLKYQVQISRALNPRNVEDRGYLSGLPAVESTLEKNEVWFAVFIRAEYDKKKGAPAPTAKTFELEDTQDNVYEPIPVNNVFAYRPSTLFPTQLNPAADSPAFESPTAGALLLFKLPEANLANRPLVLKIQSPAGEGEAEIDLDV